MHSRISGSIDPMSDTILTELDWDNLIKSKPCGVVTVEKKNNANKLKNYLSNTGCMFINGESKII